MESKVKMIQSYRIPRLENPKLFDIDHVDDFESLECDINKLIIASISSGEKILSGPRIGLKKKIILIDQVIESTKNGGVHDTLVIVNPIIVDVTHERRISSLTLRYQNRMGVFVTQTFTSLSILNKLVESLKQIGENVNDHVS